MKLVNLKLATILGAPLFTLSAWMSTADSSPPVTIRPMEPTPAATATSLPPRGQLSMTMTSFGARPAETTPAAAVAHSTPSIHTFPHTQIYTTVINIALEMESKGERYADDGKLLRSRAGALGEMQVMPHTSRDPGYGVEPARDNSPEELARVGRDYLRTMLRRYDFDVEKAFAAYNGGPTAVDDSVLLAKRLGRPDEWLQYMPEESQIYATTGKARVLKELHITQRGPQMAMNLSP